MVFFIFTILVDTVEVGGSESVWLGRNDFVFMKRSSEQSVIGLLLMDKLFSKATLMRSTFHGTKDWIPQQFLQLRVGQHHLVVF